MAATMGRMVSGASISATRAILRSRPRVEGGGAGRNGAAVGARCAQKAHVFKWYCKIPIINLSEPVRRAAMMKAARCRAG